MATDNILPPVGDSIQQRQLSKSKKRNTIICRSKETTATTVTTKLSFTKDSSLLSKSSIFPSTERESKSPQLARSRQKQQQAPRRERTAASLQPNNRLPMLYSISQEIRRVPDEQRKQIYALNRLMRKLEQERFQNFCRLNGIPVEEGDEIALAPPAPVIEIEKVE
ncbi:unnamed protein product [Didymodactylos carnosus]|uniref:Uncharacterized protein n=1 Tax=Didymodactylos carnosus TaxID=1234261 RepID=A0A814INN7_9BILA|nr:unnamed protein product [Didymodactylos carnosus]CAF1028472.1 unnamed protein product [Didymodactylos carnosus]CAF3645742.1 unnamed protein product [Didymodactylos carnosus]CAF3799519.1 unnamed protein product [Didymodactylos carnosus]